MKRLLSLSLLLVCDLTMVCPLAVAQRDFEWDYPDGLGVRYLLHDRMSQTKFRQEDQPPELRALFLPKSKEDWVRLKGTQLHWGMHVYEFRGDEADNGGLGAFLRDRDPRRTAREFKIDGEESTKDTHVRLWEFTDTVRPLFEVVDRPQPRGPYRYAVSPDLGMRILVDKSMGFTGPFPVDGDNCRARFLPDPGKWIRIDGLPGPVAWLLKVYIFPGLPRPGSAPGGNAVVRDFAEFVDRADPQLKKYRREIVRRDVTDGDHREWEWIDRGGAGMAPRFFTQASVWTDGDQQVVLLGAVPANDENERPSECGVIAKLVASREAWTGKATEPGFSFYNVAASCRLVDREVGLVVYVPCGTEKHPDKKLLDVARRMAASLQPHSEGSTGKE